MEGGISSPVTQKMKLHVLNMVNGYVMMCKLLSADGKKNMLIFILLYYSCRQVGDQMCRDKLHDAFTA